MPVIPPEVMTNEPPGRFLQTDEFKAANKMRVRISHHQWRRHPFGG